MRSDRPLVSILMNCYNGEEYLRPALESVIAQIYQNWELNFWDNQSTDTTVAICKSYGDPRIRCFCSEEHAELGAARKLAFQEIRGDLVAILDADDVCHPTRLMRQVAFLDENPQAALVGSWVQLIDEKGKVFGEFRPPVNQNDLHDCLRWTNPIIHSSAMYRYRLAREAGGYPGDLINASDYGITLMLARHFRIAVVDDFLCKLRVVTTSMSHSKKYRGTVAGEELMLLQRAAVSLPLSAKRFDITAGRRRSPRSDREFLSFMMDPY